MSRDTERRCRMDSGTLPEDNSLGSKVEETQCLLTAFFSCDTWTTGCTDEEANRTKRYATDPTLVAIWNGPKNLKDSFLLDRRLPQAMIAHKAQSPISKMRLVGLTHTLLGMNNMLANQVDHQMTLLQPSLEF